MVFIILDEERFIVRIVQLPHEIVLHSRVELLAIIKLVHEVVVLDNFIKSGSEGLWIVREADIG